MSVLNIYNHLIQGLVMMRQNRYDTCSQSELKNIYRNVMRITSEQPLYKITFDAPAQEYALGIKNASISLSSTIKELSAKDDASVFQSQILTSSDPAAVEVSAMDGSSVSDVTFPVRVEVCALSTPQINRGTFLSSSDTPLVSGMYSFNIGVEDKTYSFQFNVSQGATNLELQKKLSDFINKTAVGVRSNVTQDKEKRMSRLDLTAVVFGHGAGSSLSFHPTDSRFPNDSSHGLITHFGFDHVEVAPQNTLLRVNGVEKEIRGHSYIYKNNLTLSLKEPTTSVVTINKIANQAPIVEKVLAFVSKYNDIFDLSEKNQEKNPRARKLLYELGNTMRQYRPLLDSCGLEISAGGRLSVDTERLKEAACDGSLETLFVSEQGLSSPMLKRLTNVSLNPLDYLPKTVITYPNLAARKTVNPYVSSIYCGLLYNNYC